MSHITSAMAQVSAPDFQVVFNIMPGNSLVLQPNMPHYTILAISDDLLRITNRERADVVGKGVFEAYPENPYALTATGPHNLRLSLQNTVLNKKLDLMPVVRYDIPNAEGIFEDRYWSSSSKPVLDLEGNISCIIHTTTDVTDQVKAEKAQHASSKIEKAYSQFMRVPVVAFIVSGPEYVVEFANEEAIRLLGRTADIVGKPLFESVPEAIEQGLLHILDQVRKTGEPFYSKEYPVMLFINRQEVLHYYNFVYQAYFENQADAVPTGVHIIAHDVTGQVLSRRKAEESEQQVRSVIEGSHHPIGVYLGEELRIQFANQSLIHGLGKGPDIIGKPYKEMLPELEQQGVFEQLENVFKTGIPFHSKNQRLTLAVDGKLQSYHFNYSFTPLFNATGEVYGIVNTGADITDLVLAREQIEASANESRLLANAMPQIVWIAEANGEVIYYNDRVSEFAGAKKMPDGTWKWEGLLFPDDIQPTIEAWDKAVTEGTGYEKEHRLQMKDGGFRWHLSRALPHQDANGIILKWYGTATDVHEQKENEEALQRFKFMADQARDAFILIREDGTFAYLNDMALKQWGYTKEEAFQIQVADVDPIYRQIEFKRVFELAQVQIIPPFEAVHKRKDGTLFPVEVSMAAITVDRNPHLFAVSRDITERKLAEETLKKRNEELQVINNDLDNFIYTASHDLKAPISNIEGLLLLLSDVFSMGNAEEGETQHILDLMQESVERFKHTIATLTDVVRLQQESSAAVVLVNLQEVIREVTLDLAPMIKFSGAQLEVNVNNCPAIRFSEKNMRSVVYNLLSNAIKYCSPERAPHVWLRCQDTPEYHELTVVDNGLGIDPERTHELFTMFRRFHDHVEGTGIGLYMVKKMVDNAGGHIEVESQVGIGTTFRIYFKK